MVEEITEPKERRRRPMPPPLIYRQRDLLVVLSCSRQQLENMMRVEGFPRPIPLSVRAKGWLVSEVVGWLENRRAAHP